MWIEQLITTSGVVENKSENNSIDLTQCEETINCEGDDSELMNLNLNLNGIRELNVNRGPETDAGDGNSPCPSNGSSVESVDDSDIFYFGEKNAPQE